MSWMLNEAHELEEYTVTEYDTHEEAFDAMCNRIEWLTGCSADEIRTDVDNDILWTERTAAGWIVVCKSFAWIKGKEYYDWDIKEKEGM